jgi:hypothetical protein
LLAVSNQSFWIDETLTALKAAETSLGGWWRQMTAEKHSDLQMPLYMLYAWGWAKLFGTGEWVLRAANLPWFVGGVLAFAFSFRGRGRLLAAAVATLSSFAWFYLDEARPYAMQLGASLLLVPSLRQLGTGDAAPEKRTCWVWTFCAGVAVLAGASLLGLLWCGAALACLAAVLKPAGVAELLKAARTAWWLLGLWLVGLAAYYVWTLRVGARASAAGATDWQNLFFIVYELLGFSGLGPGRLEIREAGLAAFRARALPLAVYGALLAFVLGVGLASLWRRDRRRVALVAAIALATLASLLAAGWLWHFRLLGRHCAPALAVGLLGLVAGATGLFERRGLWPKALLGGFLLAVLASSLSARLAARHRKDEYRTAAAYARTALADGRSVGWCADPHGATFYGLAFSATPTQPGQARLLINPASDALASVPLPDVVVCSKPDLYDIHGTVARRLREEGLIQVTNFTAFTAWARPPGRQPSPVR